MPTGNQKIKFKDRGTGRRGEVSISGIITITAAGAILSGATGELYTAVKNAAAGRYDLTFDRVYRTAPRLVGATLVRPDTTAFGNVSANVMQGQAGATFGTFTLQGILASTGADTDVKSGHAIHFEFIVQEL